IWTLESFLMNEEQQHDAVLPSANHAAEADAAPAGGGKSRGRKLRTPFRRRRGDAEGAGVPAEGGQGEPGDARGAEHEAEQALSYLDTASRTQQRLGKYLAS